MTKDRIEALRKKAAGMDDQAEKVVLECLEEIERQNEHIVRKRFACEHWDNSEAPEEYCLLNCRSCNGTCADWEKRKS